ncbi:dephospho-CoA kinase [Ruegeria halocynthiae]|uniref:Dephospho-CoA kinase n=1 Tax=Ruegeria halocynthiae TaxID=985054 RepID=A0A1H3BD83_9RHOB|nr:dephospho-CoA kinase [Ruegeria halocynthiae]SDX39866.1 dephospho-CoA kinase [Ruegeria halocynthiae]
MSFSLGLTGSIGMGKSTTAQMFVDEGCALWDADAAVHRLYAKAGAAVEPMRNAFPTAIVEFSVSREALKQIIANDPGALKTIENIVHPLVAMDRAAFQDSSSADILVFDIPLLFETGGDAAMDAVACVSIPSDEQKRRVMARGTMSETQFEQIRAKQMPNNEKCMRSDFVIVTDTLDHARAQVQDIVRQIRAGMADA